ncbi:hypothetical protein LTR56_024041 [Elasticomyces elasticus]|nr:hypothetical protein LTR56_024041 [Elasticomyces elasticus]KAK4908447.1 hypothetical protein LTR49_022653 [Elasticomyces elasticus]KAK5743188.1 hypothetical protein LTS12_023961 [Elasticomyces elasticus]
MAAEYSIHLPQHRIAVCRKCRHAVWPSQVTSHLRDRHRPLTLPTRVAIAQDLLAWPDLCRNHDDFTLPCSLDAPLPGLAIRRDGLHCLLDSCTFIGRTQGTLRSHWHTAHKWSAGERPGGSHCALRRAAIAERRHAAFRVHQHYFEVKCAPPTPPDVQTTPVHHTLATTNALAVANLRQELAEREHAQRQGDDWLRELPGAKEPSPWLRLTRWPVYLLGHHLPSVAALAAAPNRTKEPSLAVLCDSLDRVVRRAYQSVCDDEINAFDQVRINSFLQRPRAGGRLLQIDLQRNRPGADTLPSGKRSCALPTGLPNPPLASSSGTSLRVGRPSACRRASNARRGHCYALLRTQSLPHAAAEEVSAPDLPTNGGLDDHCLDLCIALLDHDLRGDLFESVVVGFLAAVGFNAEKGILKEAYHYTSILSGFIKIAQMLVVQKAVNAAHAGEAAYPADLLDETRERFMAHGTRSPFNWASRLRVYGKSVRDSTTCLGYISWSDDGRSVSTQDAQPRDATFEDFCQ